MRLHRRRDNKEADKIFVWRQITLENLLWEHFSHTSTRIAFAEQYFSLVESFSILDLKLYNNNNQHNNSRVDTRNTYTRAPRARYTQSLLCWSTLRCRCCVQYNNFREFNSALVFDLMNLISIEVEHSVFCLSGFFFRCDLEIAMTWSCDILKLHQSVFECIFSNTVPVPAYSM